MSFARIFIDVGAGMALKESMVDKTSLSAPLLFQRSAEALPTSMTAWSEPGGTKSSVKEYFV